MTRLMRSGSGSQVVQVKGAGAFLARPIGVLIGQGDQSADRARGVAGYEEFPFGQFPFEVTAGEEIFVAFPLDDVAFGEPLLTPAEDLQDRFQVGGQGGGYGIVVVHGREDQRFCPSQPSRSRLRYWMASATSWGAMSCRSAKSAMVRDTFRMRS